MYRAVATTSKQYLFRHAGASSLSTDVSYLLSGITTTSNMKNQTDTTMNSKRALTTTFPNKNNTNLFLNHPFDTSTSTKRYLSAQISTKETKTDAQPFEFIDQSIVRQIKADLIEADKNHDGRIDSEELKMVLRKYHSSFTDAEVVEIGELFYTGKAGGSVSHEQFIKAIERATAVAAASSSNSTSDVEVSKPPPVVAPADGMIHPKQQIDTPHPLGLGKCSTEFMYGKSHGLYTPEELDVKLTHVTPKTMLDHMAYNAVKVVRFFFDTGTGWNRGEITSEKILMRTIYLETIAAVPGMVAAIIRHFKSLRRMERDGGMLNMFLEEANNERMHLLTFVRMKNPGMFFRMLVIGGQFGFGSFFLLAYMVSPTFCHRFVGYVEEEACSTYTKIIKAIEESEDGSDLGKWKKELAPKIARSYWHLGENGTVLDMFYAVRADEAEHRDVNHVVSGIPEGHVNPLYDPEAKLDQVLLKYVQDLMKKN